MLRHKTGADVPLELMAGRYGRCEVCNDPPRERVLDYDHNHATGAFRGWLCHRCNWVLGHVDDDTDLLQALAEYVTARS